jgi:hypothetical protein
MVNRGHGCPKSSPKLGLVVTPGHGGGGKQRGQHDAAGELLTRAWMAVRRRRDGSRASAQNGDGAAMIEGQGRRTGSVGCFTGDGGCLL